MKNHKSTASRLENAFAQAPHAKTDRQPENIMSLNKSYIGPVRKQTNRPGFSGIVPVWDTLTRNPERFLRDAQMSRFSPRRPGRDKTQST